MKKKWGIVLRVAISLISIAGLVFALRGKMGEAFSIIKTGFQWEWFFLAVVVNFIALAVISWRLQLVFNVQGVKLGFLKTYYLSIVGLFFTLFFPSSLGGDVAKGYYAYQYSGKKLGSLSGVVLDRLLGFVTVVIISITAFAYYSQHHLASPLVSRFLYGGLGILIFGAVFFSNPRFAQVFQFFSFLVPSAKWRKNLADFYHSLRSLLDHKRVLASCLAISFIGQFLYFVDVYLLARSLEIDISLWPFFVFTPLVAFMSLAPSVSGLGVREAGFVFFFKGLMTSQKAFALSIVYDILFYGTAIFAGLIFAFKGGLRKDIIHDIQEVEKLEEVGHD